MEKEMNLIWEIGQIKPDMVIDCTKYPKESAALKKVCEQRHWDYKKV